MGPLGQPQRGVNAACGSVLGDAGERAARLRQRVRWAARAGEGKRGSWARVGFSWARQVGPSAGFGLGSQGRLGWAWVEFWAGLSSNSFSFLFLFLTTQTI